MKLLKTIRLAATAACAALAVVGSAFAVSAFDPTRDIAIPRAQLKYVDLNPAVQMADAYGDMSEGMHGTFGRFPANFDSGIHTHSGAYHGVVLKGVMTNPFENEENPPELEVGSYWYVPANSVHSTACVSDTPCEFFFFADSKFDFMPVE